MLFSSRNRVLLILGPLYTVLAFSMSCDLVERMTWAVTQGQRLHARRSDFQAGTTRHARSWDEVRDRFAECLRNKLGVNVTEPVDTLFRGGIDITDEQFSRYRFFTDSTIRKPWLEMGEWSYRNADVLEHEFGHAVLHDYPKLRNPLDTSGMQGEFDHASPTFHACVHYCPPNEPGCRQ